MQFSLDAQKGKTKFLANHSLLYSYEGLVYTIIVKWGLFSF